MATLAKEAGVVPEVRASPVSIDTVIGRAPKVQGYPAEICRCVNGPLAFAPHDEHCVRCGRDTTHNEGERLAAAQLDGLRLLDAAVEAERLRLRLEALSNDLDWNEVLREYRDLTEGGWN